MRKKFRDRFKDNVNKNMDTLLVILLSVIVFLYVSNHPSSHINAKLTRKPSSAPPFFLTKSSVIDLANGSLSKSLKICSKVDICVLFIYAHWDAESSAARIHIEQAAHRFDKEVTFVAINCWSPESECAEKVSFTRYPKLIVILADLKPISFNGPLLTNRIVSFIQRIMRPLCIVESQSHMLAMKASYDNVILGYFDFSKQYYPEGYFQFYATSVRSVENESLTSSVFCVLLNEQVELRQNYDLLNNGDVVLINSAQNKGKKYFYDNILRSSYLMDFLSKNVAPPIVKMLQPNLIKSLKLDGLLRQGPALFMLIGSQALGETVEYYQGMLRAIALTYSSCGECEVDHLVAILYRIHHMRLTFLLPAWQDTCTAWLTVKSSHLRKYTEENEKCNPSVAQSSSSFYSPNVTPDFYDLSSILTKLKPPNKCQANHSCRSKSCCTNSKNSIEILEKKLNGEAQKLFHHLISRLDLHLKTNWTHYVTVPHGSSTDPAVESGPKRLLNIMCGNTTSPIYGDSPLTSHILHPFLQLLAAALPKPDSSTKVPNSKQNAYDQNFWKFQVIASNLSRQGCLYNRSLTFMTIDTRLYPALSRNLGLEIESTLPVRFAIVDWKNEVSYLFNESRTLENIGNFIRDFHLGRLSFHYRSSGSPMSCDLDPVKLLEQSCQPQLSPPLCILSLSTQSLGSKCILQKLTANNPLIILYTAKWCGYCSSFYHAFISLANYFRTVTANGFAPPIFAKIDVSENDLPWQLQPERIPSILFIPTKRYMESSSLILNASSNVISIANFIKSNLENQEQWRANWPSLQSPCNETCLIDCVTILKRHKHRVYSTLINVIKILNILDASLNLLNRQIILLSEPVPWNWLSIGIVCQVEYCSVATVCIDRLRQNFHHQSFQYSLYAKKERLLHKKYHQTKRLISHVERLLNDAKLRNSSPNTNSQTPPNYSTNLTMNDLFSYVRNITVM